MLPDANALEVADRVYRMMDRLSRDFPDGMEQAILYDTTRYIRISIREVVVTLFQAVVLVVLVVFVFLGNWRATIIPAVAIPVSLIGTFAFMLATGMSINTISLFGLILAIGVVVDDAIVVVENTERHVREGLSGREAALQTMREVTGPVVATTLVLAAVFGLLGFIQELERTHANYDALAVVRYTLLTLPQQTLGLAPVIALLGTIIALARLDKTNELTVIRCAGVSLRRMTALGRNTLCSALSISSCTRCIPAVLICSTSTSP